jgi:NADH dehydrogenase
MSPSHTTPGAHRIVIVGGGAAGLELATALGDAYADGRRAQVTLVEKARTHLWKPLLHSVAAGALDRAQHELNYLAQAHWHHFTYRFGEMVGLDRTAKLVQLGATVDDEGREITPPSTVAYDTLVMAVGSVTNDFGTPGAARFAVPLETPDQASRFHRRLVNACLRANAQSEPIRPGQLHVAIIGAGATGTELAAELHRTVRSVVAYGLDRINPEQDIRIVLVEAAPRILPALPERISMATLALLRQMGVEVRTGTRVLEVRADGIVLEGGEVIASELVVWSAGVKGPDFLRDLGGLETNRINQLVVEPTLQTTRDADVFAIGDCAACPLPGSPTPVPPRAQAAHQMASHMVRQIRLRLDGRKPEPFVYRDFGSLVSLGRYSTVGSLMGFVVGRSMFVEGLFARLMYRSLYKMHQSALHGHAPVLWRTVISVFSQRVEPGVKLH